MLNDALRVAREFHNLNQSQAAEKLGVSQSFLSEIESGKKTPSLDLLQKYSEAFSLPLSAFLRFLETFDEKKRRPDYEKKIADKLVQMMKWITKQEEANSLKSED